MSKDLILRYLRATTNLYGIIPPEKVVEIYNQQNESKIGVVDILVFLYRVSGVLDTALLEENTD